MVGVNKYSAFKSRFIIPTHPLPVEFSRIAESRRVHPHSQNAKHQRRR